LFVAYRTQVSVDVQPKLYPGINILDPARIPFFAGSGLTVTGLANPDPDPDPVSNPAESCGILRNF
jgi:hypothetical protein